MGIHKDLKAGAAAVLLALIMAVQLVYTVGVFNSKKTFHTDEMWSYGLANSDGRPFLFMQPRIALSHHQGQRMYNFDEWVDGSYYKDYLVVKENERFRYDTVIYNQTLDMHPPLYYSILHTICSFFPEQFSWYFGLSINLVSLCITQIFLYLLAYGMRGVCGEQKRAVCVYIYPPICHAYGMVHCAYIFYGKACSVGL